MRNSLVALAIWSLGLNGCGTFSDAMCGPINDHVFYRGVRLDVAAIKEGGPKILLAADIPFSVVADTLTVPYLVYHELKDPPRKSRQAAADENANREKRVIDSLPKSPSDP